MGGQLKTRFSAAAWVATMVTITKQIAVTTMRNRTGVRGMIALLTSSIRSEQSELHCRFACGAAVVDTPGYDVCL